MAQNVTIAGASYSDVPAVDLPKTGGGTATFMDTSDANATAADVAQGKTCYVNGQKIVGTGGGGGTETIIIPEQTVTTSSAYTQLQYDQLFVLGDEYEVTVNGTTKTITAVEMYGSVALQFVNQSQSNYIWFEISGNNVYLDMPSALYGTYTVKVVQQSGGGGGSTLIEKSITTNGVYNASDDSADGYSKVTVNVSGGSSKNVQYYTGRDEKNVGSFTATNLSITVSKAGTYKCYWVMDRNTTSGTSGSRLYKGDNALGSEHTTWSNTNNTRVQQCEETLTFAANDVITVRVRARNTSYYCGATNFFIVEQ